MYYRFQYCSPARIKMHLAILASALVALASKTLAATYSIADNVVGNGFYDAFQFQAISDPTHGRV
jgi:hypothetical protein